ncbi:MAG: PAS domain S-box protein, partial [Rhodocyclaceae bacterium]|nr:PAS domain S-box protein [Rhodocyclaceae bacterium]
LAVHYRKPQAPPRASLAHLELLARHGGMLAEQARDAQCAGMNQRRFEALARAAADALVWVNADWTAARVLENRNFIADPGEPAGAAWRNCVAPGDQPESVAELNAAIGQRRPFEREHRVARADGSAGWAHTRALPLFDDHGELVEWLCMVGDITARKNMQHSPAGSEECMRRFIRHAPAAQAIFDRDMRFMAASERWLNEHGLYGQEWLGQAIGNLFPAMAQRCKPAIARAQAGEEAPVDEDRFVRCDGSEHWLRWTVLPWHGSDTMPDGVVILAEDISERKRVALQLADREKQYSSVIEVALDGFWIADMEGRVLDVNDAYLRRSGFSRAELLGKRIAELDAVE